VNNFVQLIKDHWIKPFIIIGLFAICLSTSILMKKWFNVDGDYLSAFATLIAAVVALYLYTDWRKPIFLNKIEDEQKELKKIIRLFKKSSDSILLFMNTKSPMGTGLNNGDLFSLEYQKLMYSLLDNADDLCTLLVNYKLILNEDQYKSHIEFINSNLTILKEINDVIGKYNPVTEYISSYQHVEPKIKKTEFIQLLEEIIFRLPDGLSEFYEKSLTNYNPIKPSF